MFLAALAVWLGAAAEAQEATSLALETRQASIAASKLASAINQACVMGDGNEVQTNCSY